MIYVEQTDSTNSRLKDILLTKTLPVGYTLYTYYQTAGRGQQGNSWESEQGKNLLFSTMLDVQHIGIEQQFHLSQIISLAVAQEVISCMREASQPTEQVKIKWPNDIYIGDKKVAGILVETALSGKQLAWAVAGVGLNVEQEKFISNAPNPISIIQATGKQFDKQQLLQRILQNVTHYTSLLKDERGCNELQAQYLSMLYRHNSWHYWRETTPSTMPQMISQDAEGSFKGKIVDVLSDGRLVIEMLNHQTKAYNFKQIKYIIPQTE